jgi:hypothetical protein
LALTLRRVPTLKSSNRFRNDRAGLALDPSPFRAALFLITDFINLSGIVAPQFWLLNLDLAAIIGKTARASPK